jgi:hypothetical protein
MTSRSVNDDGWKVFGGFAGNERVNVDVMPLKIAEEAAGTVLREARTRVVNFAQFWKWPSPERAVTFGNLTVVSEGHSENAESPTEVADGKDTSVR